MKGGAYQVAASGVSEPTELCVSYIMTIEREQSPLETWEAFHIYHSESMLKSDRLAMSRFGRNILDGVPK